MKDIDFIPAERHARRCQKRLMKLRAGSISVMLVLMVLWAVSHFRELATAQAMVAQLDTQRDELTRLLESKSQLLVQREQLERRSRLVSLLEQDENISVVFSDVSRRMPPSVFLTALALDSPSVSRWAVAIAAESQSAAAGSPAMPGELATIGKPLTAVEPPPVAPVARPSRMVMNGVASETAEVIRFAAALEESPLFARVQMRVKDPVIWSGRRAESFELICDLFEHVRRNREVQP